MFSCVHVDINECYRFTCVHVDINECYRFTCTCRYKWML